MARTAKGRRREGGGPKKPAATKSQAKKHDEWKSKTRFEAMLGALAQIASASLLRGQDADVPAAYRELFDADVGPYQAQLIRDERFLRQVYRLVMSYWMKPPFTEKGQGRVSDGARRLADARRDTEVALRHATPPATPERDEGLATLLGFRYRCFGLECSNRDVASVLSAVRQEFRASPSKDRGDWIGVCGGPSEAAGIVVQRLGVRLGWTGSSKGNTKQTLKSLAAVERARAARTANPHLKTVALLLRAAGLDDKYVPVTMTVVGLQLAGYRVTFEIEPAEGPPNLEGLLTMKHRLPANELGAVADELALVFAAGNLRKLAASLRAQIENRNPGFLPVHGQGPTKGDQSWALWQGEILRLALGEGWYAAYQQRLRDWMPSRSAGRDAAHVGTVSRKTAKP